MPPASAQSAQPWGPSHATSAVQPPGAAPGLRSDRSVKLRTTCPPSSVSPEACSPSLKKSSFLRPSMTPSFLHIHSPPDSTWNLPGLRPPPNSIAASAARRGQPFRWASTLGRGILTSSPPAKRSGNRCVSCAMAVARDGPARGQCEWKVISWERSAAAGHQGLGRQSGARL